MLALTLLVALGGLLETWPVHGQPPASHPRQFDGPLVLAESEHLPTGFATEILKELTIRLHRDRSLAMAFYQPGLAPAQAQAEWRGGTLWLYEPHYPIDASGRLTVAAAPPDVVEYLGYSLLLAYLHRALADDPELASQIRRRAGAQAPAASIDGPPSERDGLERAGVVGDAELAAYVLATASFGSHLLSLANEIERSERRRRDSGRGGLCPMLRREEGLFSLWVAANSEQQFVGSAFDQNGREVPVAIDAEDKKLIRDRVFGGFWAGSVARDFGKRYCSAP